jgi:hypothetical protein
LPFSKGSAKADVMLNAKLGGPVSAKGKILGEDAHFSVIEHGRAKEYDLSTFELFFDSSYFEQVIEISSVELHGPGFSASARSKVDFNNITNPHISLGVESPFMPLETFKQIFPTPVVTHLVEEIFFPICSGGDARLTDLTMNGTLDQFRHICLPENKDLLSMKVEWKDIIVEKDGKGLPFEKVSGEIGIEGQGLSLSISNAVFGGSIIKSASMKINSLCGDHLYNITGKGLFELDDLKKQADLAFMPQAVVSALKEFKDLAGKMEAQVDMTLNQGFVNPRVINGEFLFKDCLIGRDDILLPLSLDEAHVLVSNEYKGLFEGGGHWGRSEFQASGSTSDLWNTFQANISSSAQADELLNLFFQGRQFPISNRGLVSCQMEIERMDDKYSVKGETDLKDVVMDKGTVFLDPPGENNKAIFDMDFFPGKEIRMNDLRLDLDGTGIKVKGSYDLINKDEIRLNVSTERLPLRCLGIRSQGGDLNVQGLLTCNTDLRVFLKDPKKTTMSGNASGQDISFAVTGLASSVSDCQFKLNFSGQDISIHSLDMRVGQSTLDIKGLLKGWDGFKGELAVESGYLNLGDFVAKEPDSGQITSGQDKLTESPAEGELTSVERPESTMKKFVDRMDLQFSMNAKKGQWKRLGLGPLHAQCLLRSGDFYMERADVQLEHGIFSVKGHVKKEQGPERINIISNIKMAGQPASEILYSLGTDGKALEGTMSLESNLATKGGNCKDLISGLTGNASLSMENGCITSSFSTVFKVLDVLSLMNIFKTRLPDLSEKGLYFETIEANAEIKDGIIHTDDLAIKGPILNAVVQGTVDLSRKWEDMIFWAQTLETLDTVVSWVPIIGYILTEKENAPKGVVIYPVKIRGDWNDPEIKLLPSVKNLGSGVINIFKRLLNTPGRIFKKISGVKDGLANAVNVMPERDGQPVESTGRNEYLD